MQIADFISVALNFLALMLTAYGTYVMIMGIDADEHLAADGWGSIKYFTVQSNMLYGVYAGVFAMCELLYGSADNVPHVLYVLKYVFTVGVTLTMMTVLCYLAPVVEKSYPKLFKGANLYFHLLVPLLGIAAFCFFEKNAHISIPETFLGLIPFGLYGIFYTINALSHAENGKVDMKYDWYGYVKDGVDKAAVASLIMTVSATAICFGIVFINSIDFGLTVG